MNRLNEYIRTKKFGSGIDYTLPTLSDNTTTKEIQKITAPTTDPRIIKLRKELEKLNIAPKAKFININFK